MYINRIYLHRWRIVNVCLVYWDYRTSFLHIYIIYILYKIFKQRITQVNCGSLREGFDSLNDDGGGWIRWNILLYCDEYCYMCIYLFSKYLANTEVVMSWCILCNFMWFRVNDLQEVGMYFQYHLVSSTNKTVTVERGFKLHEIHTLFT
jgi:hypothetical protein